MNSATNPELCHHLQAAPTDLIEEGKYNNKVPVLIGANRDEYAFFSILLKVPEDLNEVGFDMLLGNFPTPFTSRQKEELKKLYGPESKSGYPCGARFYIMPSLPLQ
jgi:hypothetical protein